MAAVTTDIPLRRRTARPTRLLAPVPELPVGRRGSVQVIGVPPWAEMSSAEVRRPARIAPLPGAYRLRRAVAVAVVLVLALCAWLVLEAVAGVLGVTGTPAPASSAAAVSTIAVAPGDTYWSIATRLQPQGDPRPLVDRLVAAHGGGLLKAGEHLVVGAR